MHWHDPRYDRRYRAQFSYESTSWRNDGLKLFWQGLTTLLGALSHDKGINLVISTQISG